MKRWMVLGCGLAGLPATPAQADEQYFGYTYSAEVLGKGETEAEFWATDRRGKAEGHYDAQNYKLELEHGFTNRFSVSGYANFVSHHIRGSANWTPRGGAATSRDPAVDGFGERLSRVTTMIPMMLIASPTVTQWRTV